MILDKSTLAATLATVALGALMINPASAAYKWSDISSVTNRNEPEVHTVAGGKESFSRTDLTAVTHKKLSGKPKQVGRISMSNYRGSDLTKVTHTN